MSNKLFATFAWVLLFHAPAFALDGPWPQWRGSERDDISAEANLLQSWPEGGPEMLWSVKDCGLGYSGPAIVGNRLFTLGLRDGEEKLICFDATSGEELWSTVVGTEYENGWGNGPRATPTVDGEFVFAVGGNGTLACYRADDGSQVWSKSVLDFGGKVPVWGYSESPLIHEDKVLYTPGGEQGAIVALDKTTGELLWQTKDLTDEAHYSSKQYSNSWSRRYNRPLAITG